MMTASKPWAMANQQGCGDVNRKPRLSADKVFFYGSLLEWVNCTRLPTSAPKCFFQSMNYRKLALILFILSGVLAALALASYCRGAVQAVPSGKQVDLSVTADGTAPFSYQWMKDGINIPSATNSTLTLLNFSLAQAGDYTAQVTNSAGSTVSDKATLNLLPVSTAPDFSSYWCYGETKAAFTPPATTWFTVPIAPLEDPGTHFTALSFLYAITDPGTYEITLRARPADMSPPGVSFALSAFTSNADSQATLWCSTNPTSNGYQRNGALNLITATYKAGDQIRVLLYTQSPLNFYGVSFAIKRIR